MTAEVVSSASWASSSLTDGLLEPGPITVVGGATHRDVGGVTDPATRPITAPSSVIEPQPTELLVRVDAGVTLESLDAELAALGQRVVLDGQRMATVGGVLAVGRSGICRLGDGHVRDALVGGTMVGADGIRFAIGGSTVKNVSGFDLCRLMVGSLGVLACFETVLLRTIPRSGFSQWMMGPTDPTVVMAILDRPASVLWDGIDAWVLVRGGHAQVDDDVNRLADLRMIPVAGPPDLPPHRWSLRPSQLAELGRNDADEGRFVAEMGVGVVHRTEPAPTVAIAHGVATLHRRLRDHFDPDRRLNPGKQLAGVS